MECRLICPAHTNYLKMVFDLVFQIHTGGAFSWIHVF
jgi:hypothetical protein